MEGKRRREPSLFGAEEPATRPLRPVERSVPPAPVPPAPVPASEPAPDAEPEPPRVREWAQCTECGAWTAASVWWKWPGGVCFTCRDPRTWSDVPGHVRRGMETVRRLEADQERD